MCCGDWQSSTDLWPAAAYSGSGSPLSWTRDIYTLLKYFLWRRPKTKYHWAPEMRRRKRVRRSKTKRKGGGRSWGSQGDGNKAVFFKETSKVRLLQKMLIRKYLIRIQQMPSVDPAHFYFFMFLNWALIFMPDNSWSRVAMGSTTESQRVPEQNFHKSRRCLNKHRWSWKKDRTNRNDIFIYKL